MSAIKKNSTNIVHENVSSDVIIKETNIKKKKEVVHLYKLVSSIESLKY